jgi:ubiquinone/menaquinone biosynthesis C-methylase UbiE
MHTKILVIYAYTNMKSSHTKAVYNQDVTTHGGYVYTTSQSYSAVLATQKQTDEIHALINRFFSKPISILDMGCGDGTYTFQMAMVVHPKKITGFDMSEQAIRTAKKHIPNNKKSTITFDIGDLYNVASLYKKGRFELGILRGVLHHMEDPARAIREISKVVDSVVVLEPNGYNPILKIIEKISPYHREHGEKSYWPPHVNKWFTNAGYSIVSQQYFSIIPYFFPDVLVKLLKPIEPCVETIPIIRNIFCGGILSLYKKML